MNKKLKLGLIMQGPGRSWTDWLHPKAQPGAMTDFKFFANQARVVEGAKFDFLFLADGVFVTPKSAPYGLSKFEPLTVMSALSVVTSHIGLVATVSSSFFEPFNVARQFSSLDHLSGGRAGWNLVTSFSDGSALNFSQDGLEDHEVRYRRGAEHLDVVQGLWDTWEEGALLHDKQSRRFFDPDKLNTLDHEGEFYRVKGPLNISRAPQGQPVIFQAGASETGRDFAARHADVIFVATEDINAGRAFYADVKQRAVRYGRDPSQLLVVPGMHPFIGETEADAEAIFEERANLMLIDDALAGLAKFFEQHDFSPYDLDGPFPRALLNEHINGFESTVRRVGAMADEGLTIRQIALRLAHPKGNFVGTAEQIADKMQAWLEAEAADGFMIAESSPGQLEVFAEKLVPILQERGIYRREYEGTTLRASLGLREPPNRFSQAKAARQDPSAKRAG